MINNLPEDLQNLIYKAYFSDNVLLEMEEDFICEMGFWHWNKPKFKRRKKKI